MNNENKRTSSVIDDGTYVVKKSRKSSIFAFIVCVLVAFIIWASAEATEKKQQEALQEQIAVVAENT